MGQRKSSRRSTAPSRYSSRLRARPTCQQSRFLNPAVCDPTSHHLVPVPILIEPDLYEYQALNTLRREIRILKLETTSSTNSATQDQIRPASALEPVRGSMIHVPLLELQDFVALSYTWGDPKQDHSLLVEGKRIPITESLHDVLVHLRRRTELLHVWIDGVCINQKDVEEKGSQIQLMSKIYQSAKDVISWIGMPDVYTDFLFTHIRGRSLDDIKARTFGDVQICLNAALTALGKRPYWTRVWVLQEFTVGKRVRIMCGDDLEDSDLILDLVHQFMRQKGQPELLVVSPFQAMCMARREHHKKQVIGLLEMLIMTASMYENLWDRVIRRAFKSTDIIDQIYGLLGLVDDQEMFLLEPDCKVERLNDLFINMTRRFISISGQLELCFLEHGKEPVNPADLGATKARSYTPTDLPGWCPDYLNLVNSHQNTELINALGNRQATPADLTGPRHRYSELSRSWDATAKSRLTKDSYHLYDDGRMLLMGKLVGTIISPSSWETHIAPSAFTRDENELACFSWLNPLLMAYASTPIVTNDRILDALPFLLSDDKCFVEDAIPEAMCCNDERKELKEWILGSKVSDDLASLIVRRLSEWNIAANLPTAVSSEELHQAADQIMDSVLPNYAYFGRKIAAYRANGRDASVSRVVREFGAYGWVPSSARADDEIWLLKGCSIPMVLRRIAQPATVGIRMYARIGPALVNGAMRGEMWSDDDLSSVAVVKTPDTVVTPLSRSVT